MARGSRTPATLTAPPNITASINLTRLLSRLESSLFPSSSQAVKISSLDRTKIGANIEYARSLLAQFETVPSKGPQASFAAKDIASKKLLIRKLNERLFELDQLDSSSEDSDIDSETEDILAGIDDEPPTKQTPQASSPPDSTLRVRHLKSSSTVHETLHTTSSSTVPAPSNLPPRLHSSTAQDSPSSSIATTEKLLDHNTNEQEVLTADLLSMAQRLKESSKAFATSLDEEDGVLGRVVGALDKNADGMKAAEGRMGTLRRMTEGLGFFNRMWMYAWIAAAWVALILLMTLPKFR